MSRGLAHPRRPLHHSAHPTHCRALFIAGDISAWTRATTSDQPITPSPNEQNIKPPTLILLQSFFFPWTTTPKLRVFRTGWQYVQDYSLGRLRSRRVVAGGPGLSIDHDRLLCVVFPAPTNWMQSLQAEGATAFVPFRKAMRRSPFRPHPPTDAPTLRALLQHCSPMRTTLQRPQRPHKRQA